MKEVISMLSTSTYTNPTLRKEDGSQGVRDENVQTREYWVWEGHNSNASRK
jgi:hypothetical protein